VSDTGAARVKPGRVILLNGTSSAGKTTLALALREIMTGPWCYHTAAQLADAGFRDRDKPSPLVDGTPRERHRFFAGFHRSIAAFADTGNSLIVEHIIETPAWRDDLARTLAPFDTYLIGVHCPPDELRRREATRVNRYSGEAEFHLQTHDFCTHDLEVDGTKDPAANAKFVVNAWIGRTEPRALFA